MKPNYTSDTEGVSKPERALCTSLASVCRLSLLILSSISTLAQPSPTPDPKFWMTDGPVSAILVTNDSIYLGGDFTYVGPRTGPAGVFDQATGVWIGSPPRIQGLVRAVVPDGNGGWFIGGTFTSVGGFPITNVAHLKWDLTVNTRWNAAMVGTVVNALVLDNNILYVGGSFTRVGGKQLTGLVGVSASDATLKWEPNLSGSVSALDLANGLVYAGGNFFSVGNSNRQNLAAIDVNTALANAWNPVPDQTVFVVKASGTTVYVGGQFTVVGTKPRNRLAALDSAGVANNWNPNPNGIVRALAVAGSSVYVGGDFTTIGGQNRRGFAFVSANGAVTPQSLDISIQPPVTVANLVRDILVDGNSIYVGGSLTNALGATHRLLVGVPASGGAALPTPALSDYNGAAFASFGINAMARQNGQLFVAGEFQSIGGVPRQRAAALSRTTGSVLPWAPTFSGPVLTLAYGSDVVYAGGNFTNVNGTNFARGLAAVDQTLGTLDSGFRFLGTNQFADVVINSLALGNNRLFVGGAFITVADLSRRFLAAVNPDNGTPIAGFDAKLAGGFSGVTALALTPNGLYVAGDFSSVNSQSVPRLALVSATDGALQNWTPNPNQLVTALTATSDNLYVGGNFSMIAGTSFKGFAAFSLTDNSLQGVDAALPAFAQGLTAIGATPTSLYLGGAFDSAGGEFRLNLVNTAAFNASSYEWDPAPDAAPAAIAVTDDLAVIGGPFRFFGRFPTNTPNGFLAVFPRGASVSRISKAAGNTLRLTTTTGDRTDAVLQTTSDLANPAWVSVATNEIPGFTWTLDLPLGTGNQYYRAVAR